jgi:AbrB family looped-hinge helix DNA binding protein
MTTLKVHYDGWISLPVALRQQLGLHSGARLEVHLVEGAIVLRPAKGTRAPTDPEAAIEILQDVSAPAPSVEAALPQQRPRGRPRKVPTLERPAAPMPGTGADHLPPPKRQPGRPRKVRVEAVEPVAAPGPSSVAGGGGLWKLRPKAAPPAASPEPVPPPRRPEPSRTGGSQEREERRPFRNVEVRKLGPGRRHNRLQRGMNPTG